MGSSEKLKALLQSTGTEEESNGDGCSRLEAEGLMLREMLGPLPILTPHKRLLCQPIQSQYTTVPDFEAIPTERGMSAHGIKAQTDRQLEIHASKLHRVMIQHCEHNEENLSWHSGS